MDFPGVDGFLGNRASLMLDVVFLAMFAVLDIWDIDRDHWRHFGTAIAL